MQLVSEFHKLHFKIIRTKNRKKKKKEPANLQRKKWCWKILEILPTAIITKHGRTPIEGKISKFLELFWQRLDRLPPVFSLSSVAEIMLDSLGQFLCTSDFKLQIQKEHENHVLGWPPCSRTEHYLVHRFQVFLNPSSVQLLCSSSEIMLVHPPKR